MTISANIPASKKKNVNGAEVIDTTAGNDEINNQFRKQRKPVVADNKAKQNLKKIAEEKAKNQDNKDLEVFKDPDIMETCRKEGL